MAALRRLSSSLPSLGDEWEEHLSTGKKVQEEVCHLLMKAWEVSMTQQCNIFDAFEGLASQSQVFGDKMWTEARGCFGQAVPQIVLQEALQTPGLRSAYLEVFDGMVAKYPALLGNKCTVQPIVGQTVLHLACGYADAELLEKFIGLSKAGVPLDLDARATGAYYSTMIPANVENVTAHPGVTALMILLYTGATPETANHAVEMLLKAGASPHLCAEDGSVITTLLHTLTDATTTCSTEISVDRTRLLIRTLVQKRGPRDFKPLSVFQRDADGYTPLEKACVSGNEAAFTELIKHSTTVVWDWGGREGLVVPMSALCYAEPGRLSLLELMTCHGQKRMMSLGLVADIVEDKWRASARFICMMEVGVILSLAVATTFALMRQEHLGAEQRGELGEESIRSQTNRYLVSVVGRQTGHLVADVTAIIISSVYLLIRFSVPMFSSDARVWLRCFWSQKGYFELTTMRNTFMAGCSLVLVISSLFFVGPTFNSVAAVLVLFAWVQLLRFFELWSRTGLLASSMQQMFARDLIPFLIVLTVILVGMSGAIRISVSDKAHDKDTALNSWVAAAVTLGESIHGPDVKFRYFLSQGAITAALFLTFIWAVGILMVNALIAMFTGTYEAKKQTAYEEFIYRRAQFVCSADRLTPHFIFAMLRSCGLALQIGHTASFIQRVYGGPHSGINTDAAIWKNSAAGSRESDPLVNEERWWYIEHNKLEASWCSHVTNQGTGGAQISSIGNLDRRSSGLAHAV